MKVRLRWRGQKVDLVVSMQASYGSLNWLRAEIRSNGVGGLIKLLQRRCSEIDTKQLMLHPPV